MYVALTKQLSNLKSFMSWNGYPTHVVRSLFKRLQENSKRGGDPDDAELLKVFVKISYAGEQVERLLRSSLRKLSRFTKENVRFVTLFQTKKLSMFCPTKDKIPVLQ